MGPARNVLVTGYWEPTNEMLREFSTEHNLGGWEGRNWRGYGFDIYAYFPQFEIDENESPFHRPGFGDLRVDYQDTSMDWWSITDRLRPIAIVTFSVTLEHVAAWELEPVTVNRDSWQSDYEEPVHPTPSPPDDSVPVGFERESTLPMDQIVERVNNADLVTMDPTLGEVDVTACIDRSGDAGGFLSEYIGYHASWYQAQHSECSLRTRCIAAGHVHVGWRIDLDTAREATRITLEAVLEHAEAHIPDCLSVRDVAHTCGGHTAPVSLRTDVLGGRVEDTARLKPRLVEVLSDCR